MYHFQYGNTRQQGTRAFSNQEFLSDVLFVCQIYQENAQNTTTNFWIVQVVMGTDQHQGFVFLKKT